MLRAMLTVDATISRIRAFAAKKGWKPSRFAVEVGLHRNSLLGMNREGWSPSLTTLRTLEQFILDDRAKAKAA